MTDKHTAKLSQTLERSDIPLENITSPALTRIVEEVRNDRTGVPDSTTAYNRTYHRHNR